MPKQTTICPVCKGEQWVVVEVDNGRKEITERCPECKGNGFVYVENTPTKKTAPLGVAGKGIK